MTRSLPTRTAARAALVLGVSLTLTAPVAALSSASAAAGPRAASSRVIPFTAASLDPGADAGTWTLTWAAPKSAGDVTAYLSEDGGATYGTEPVATGGPSGTATIATSATRPFVELVPAKGAPLDVANRVLGLASNTNFRDAGGYRTSDGRWVKYGLVYRSGQLTLTDEDAATVATLGIVSDYDLRTNSEIASTQDVAIEGMRYVHDDVLTDKGPGGNSSEIIANLSKPKAVNKIMHDMEMAFVDRKSATKAYHALFTEMAKDSGASLYHCTAGKDRTGWASEVLLRLLGVPQKTITADYLLSNTYYLESPNVQAQINSMPDNMKKGLIIAQSVKKTWLNAALKRVKKEYGSMQGYALKGLHLTKQTITKLQDKYLAGAATK